MPGNSVAVDYLDDFSSQDRSTESETGDVEGSANYRIGSTHRKRRDDADGLRLSYQQLEGSPHPETDSPTLTNPVR